MEPEQGGGNVELAVVAETDVDETIVVIWLKTPLKAWELIEFKELLEVFAGIDAGGTNNPFWLTGGVLVDLAPEKLIVLDDVLAGIFATLVGVGVPLGTNDKLNDKETPVLFTLLKIAKLPNTKALVPIGFIGAKIFVVTPLMLVWNIEFFPKPNVMKKVLFDFWELLFFPEFSESKFNSHVPTISLAIL